MKTSVTENDVIALIRESQEPLTVDAIATKFGVIRHTLNPVLHQLISQGTVVKKDLGGSPAFALSDTSAVQLDAAANEAKPTGKPETQKKNNVTSIKNRKTVSSTKLTETPKQPTNQQDDHAPAEKSIQILAFIAEKPRRQVDLSIRFGECDAIIEQLKADEMVLSHYIMDEYTYLITEKAKKQYPDLKDIVIDQGPVGAGTTADEPAADHTALLAAQILEAANLSKPDSQAQNENALDANNAKDKPAVVKNTRVSKKAEKTPKAPKTDKPEPVVDLPAQSPAAADNQQVPGVFEGVQGEDKEVMNTIALMLEALVEKRLQSARSIPEKSLTELAEKMREASKSLRQAASALDDGLDLIEKL